MNLQKKGVKRIAVNVLIITKKTQKGDPAMKIIILSTLFLLFLLMTAAIYLCIFYEYLAEYHAHRIPRMSVDECG